MKKILALVLAVVMAMGVASVGFAAAIAQPAMLVDGNGELNLNYVYKMDTNTNKLVKLGFSATTGKLDEFKQGTTLYIPLQYKGAEGDAAFELGGTDDTMTSTEMGKYKVATDWLVGKDLFKEAKIEYKKFPSDKYNYVIALYTNAASNVKLEDVLGWLTIYKTSAKNQVAPQKAFLNFATYGYAAKALVADLSGVVASSAKVVSFSGLTDETITFDGVGEFEVNVWQQGKLFLGFNMDFNKEIAAMYDDAELEFVNFVGYPSFNKWGTFYLYGEEGSYVYEVGADGKMKKVDATWDAAYDAYKFGAKRLGTFITSDKELDVAVYNNAKAAPEAPSTETPVDGSKPIPNTGR